MPELKPREKIKKRFIQAVELISQENYPAKLQTDIIKSIGLAPTNYYGMRSKKGLYPTLEHCYALCNKYKVSADWLIIGKGEMRKIDVSAASVGELLRAAVTQLKANSAQTKAQTKKDKKQ